MTNTTLDGSSTPVVIAAGSIEQVNDGDTLFLLGAIDNLGTIFADTTGTPTTLDAVSIVVASPVVTLEGGGSLLLGDAFGALVFGSGATPETLINVDNTIMGSGGVGPAGSFTIGPGETAYPFSITNEAHGVIDGSATLVQGGSIGGPGLSLATGTLAFVNDGLVEATGNAGLELDSATIDQSGGGTILASGAGVIVGSEFFGASGGAVILGGALEVSGGGSIALNSATLDGSVSPLTVGSGVYLPEQSISDLLGTIGNSGTIAMTGAAFGIGNIFLASPTVTLTGTGEVLDPALSGTGGNPVVLVNIANTITGVGFVGIATIDTSSFGPIGSSAPVAVTNEAAGVIDATGTAANPGGGGDVTGDAIYLVGGAVPMINDGLMEATGIGGLDISNSTLDQSGGGTLLASGAGVAVYMQDVDLIGGNIESSDGGTIEFNGGTNTLTSGPGPLVISSGAVLAVTTFVTTGTLTLQAGTIDNLGTLLDQGSLILASPSTTLEGGGLVQLGEAVTTSGTVTLINQDNEITGGGLSGAALAMTNDAGGVIDGTELDVGGTLVNAGLLENVGVGLSTATTIDNIGTGELLAGAGGDVALYSGDIIGGTLAATGGGGFTIGGGNASSGLTLDGRGAPVTIEAGTTLQDFFDEISLPFTFEASGGLTLLGTIDFDGTVLGANPENVESGGYTIPNAGLLVGTGEISGYVANTGTLLAQGGTLTVTGAVDGSGSIAIASGSAFVLGGESGETVDFRDAQDSRLVLNTPTAFTGTLANMTYGDIFDVGTEDIVSAKVVGGDTLAVTLADSSTIDYALAGLHAGTSFEVGAVASELVVACFAEGTRIRTTDGDRAVETLRAGDAVVTVGGRLRNIIWVGHRWIRCSRQQRPQDVQPVRVRARAFGRNVPQADLWLSPDHAVFVDGVLIPVRYLVNGATIVRETLTDITYWHVELDAHDVLLAENLPCESYLDTGNRRAFVECDATITSLRTSATPASASH